MNRAKGSISAMLGILAVLLAINWLATEWHTRLDLTDEKRFTLSNATRKLLKKIDEPVSIDVFLKGNYPSGFRKLGTASMDMLQEFKEVAGSKLNFHLVSPDEKAGGTEVSWGDSLTSMGVYPINLNAQIKEGQQQLFVYPVAVVRYKDRLLPVTLYLGKSPMINSEELNSAEAMLEYNFSDAISKITQKERPTIAYATGNGEPVGYETYDLIENTLKPNYNVFTFDLNAGQPIPKEFNVMLVVKPTQPFSDEAKLKLDQYVMHGGKVIICLDRLNAEMDSLRIKNEVVAYDRELGVNDLLFRYGVRINPDLIMDLQCDYLPFDISGNGQFEFLPWNYFPVLEAKANHPIVKNLGFVSGKFVNSIDTVEAEGIRKTILLSSSVNARKIGSPALISSRENVNAPEDEKFRTAYIPAACLLEGKFRSMFANRLSQSMRDSLSKYDAAFLPECTSNTKIVVVADGDIILNSMMKGNQPIPMGMNPFTYGSQREFPFANKNFLQNCIDYLVDESGLSEAKSKDYSVRLLDPKKVSEEKTFWQLINIALPVIIVILFGLLFQWRKKKKYSI